MTRIICGVDVSARSLDARIGLDGPLTHLANSPEGLTQLIAFCRQHSVALVVLEATGGYERQALARLWAEEIPVALVNPRHVRRLAESMGVLEKTDRIDCGLIAHFAQVCRVRPTPPVPETQAKLTALVVRLRQLTRARVEQTNQRRLVTDADALASFTPLLAAIGQQIRALEAKIDALIDQDPLWARINTVLRSLKGVAARTVAHVLAELPEIGTLSNKAVAKLVGVAPLARDSGQHRGRRSIRAGRAGLRSLLFVVAEIVRRHEPDFRDFHHRLKLAGKPPKVIRIALAHKLLVRLNAKVREIRTTAAQTPQAA